MDVSTPPTYSEVILLSSGHYSLRMDVSTPPTYSEVILLSSGADSMGMCAAWLNSFSANGLLTPSVFKVLVRQTVIWVCGHLKSRKGGGRRGGGREGGIRKEEGERKKTYSVPHTCIFALLHSSLSPECKQKVKTGEAWERGYTKRTRVNKGTQRLNKKQSRLSLIHFTFLDCERHSSLIS